ncbi:MAG: cyclase family protein [Thermoleophilia bacterium]|nr:cyclase family protein [Thermoleophilia bacterium]
MEYFDLTLPLLPGMPVYPGDPEVRFTAARTHETDGYQVTRLCLGSHSGTHLDAPRHFLAEGATLDEYRVDRLVGPGVVVDCRPPSGGPDTYEPGEIAESPVIDAVLLRERMKAFSITAGSIVVVWTEGAPLTADAGEFLSGLRPVIVGTDAASLDAEPHAVHRLLLGQGILLAENLQGLDRLGPGPATFAFLPLAVVATDGAPARVIAWR